MESPSMITPESTANICALNFMSPAFISSTLVARERYGGKIRSAESRTLRAVTGSGLAVSQAAPGTTRSSPATPLSARRTTGWQSLRDRARRMVCPGAIALADWYLELRTSARGSQSDPH